MNVLKLSRGFRSLWFSGALFCCPLFAIVKGSSRRRQIVVMELSDLFPFYRIWLLIVWAYLENAGFCRERKTTISGRSGVVVLFVRLFTCA